MWTAWLIAVVTVQAGMLTNAVEMTGAPPWLKARRVEKVTERIERALEWNVRRVRVFWYSNEGDFIRAHGFDASVLAFTRRADGSVHLGRLVNDANFDGVFGHELAHVILLQKYRDAIPKWLEEGLANHVARRGGVDYKYLAGAPATDVRSLVHPFQAVSTGEGPPAGGQGVRYHYMASTALIEMIASKCSLHSLLQLSVGEKLEGYLATFCRVSDVNASFREWVKRKAGAR